jgi:hypothetical protein
MRATDRLLRAVSRANDRLAELGLGDTHAVVYTGHHARLLGRMGEELLIEQGPPALACGLLMGRFELSLRALLMGYRDEIQR